LAVLVKKCVLVVRHSSLRCTTDHRAFWEYKKTRGTSHAEMRLGMHVAQGRVHGEVQTSRGGAGRQACSAFTGRAYDIGLFVITERYRSHMFAAYILHICTSLAPL
jgi:hypothetical protein